MKPYVDLEARLEAATLIEALTNCQITNFAFDDAYPSTRDRAVRAIRFAMWMAYDDLHEHRLEGRYALSPEGVQEVQRWILFLRSDLPYRWPPLALSPLPGWLTRRIWTSYEFGDVAVWPFLKQSDLDAALP